MIYPRCDRAMNRRSRVNDPMAVAGVSVDPYVQKVTTLVHNAHSAARSQ